MTVRRASLEDIPEIVAWGRKFYDASPWPGKSEFCPESLKNTLSSMIEGQGAVFLNGSGICGGVIFPLFFNSSDHVAVELFWFAERGGWGLRKAFEAWAQDAGAKAMQWTCLADENEPRMRKHYSRLGFEPMETSFWRAF